MLDSFILKNEDKQGVNYILSPCCFFSYGLSRLMFDYGVEFINLPYKISSLPEDKIISRIVVFLPETPVDLLNMLQKTAKIIEQIDKPLPLLLLSSSPLGWLWNTLSLQVSDHNSLQKVRAAFSDLPVYRLKLLLHEYVQDSYPTLKQVADEERRQIAKTSAGLTKPELEALLGLLNGDSVAHQARLKGVSHKTLYAQRAIGMKKMAEYHPLLMSSIPGYLSKDLNQSLDCALSTYEREFIHAIYCKEIFTVFQPVTSNKKNLEGFEILSRWHHNGTIVHPANFLPQIKSEYALMILTAFTIYEAIECIINHPGDFYFSVNVPTIIADNPNLLPMLENARKQLGYDELPNRLALEFSEDIDFRVCSTAADNTKILQEKGFIVMLDDCFSNSSVVFPARNMKFNYYKLDISIVNDIDNDPYALALVKTLVYYCQQVKSQCIAEGVENSHKLEQLSALGINLFQGYYISHPIEKHKIPDLIKSKSATY